MVTIRVPATTANLGPGFDTLGLALALYNQVSMEEICEGLEFKISGEGAEFIPGDDSNIVYKAAAQVYGYLNRPVPGLRIHLHNGIPIARGLGSSAAAIIGGMVAASRLAGSALSDAELLMLATRVEGHPDNITPALLGGLTISCMNGEEVVFVKTELPGELKAVVAIPDFQLTTADARKVLPKEVSLQDAVYNVSRSSLLVAGLMSGNLDVLGTAMDDRLHQPYRACLIPGLPDVFTAGKDAGALAVVISGSGPTIIAFAKDNLAAIGVAMQQAFAEHSITSRVMETGVCLAGAHAVGEEAGEAVAQ
jgi:homoserine kinase